MDKFSPAGVLFFTCKLYALITWLAPPPVSRPFNRFTDPSHCIHNFRFFLIHPVSFFRAPVVIMKTSSASPRFLHVQTTNVNKDAMGTINRTILSSSKLEIFVVFLIYRQYLLILFVQMCLEGTIFIFVGVVCSVLCLYLPFLVCVKAKVEDTRKLYLINFWFLKLVFRKESKTLNDFYAQPYKFPPWTFRRILFR